MAATRAAGTTGADGNGGSDYREIRVQLAESRAPQGFGHIHEVIPARELEDIAAAYKQTAGFDRDTVNRRFAAMEVTSTRPA